MAEPGGDAADAQQAALLRQLEEPWGARTDKDNQVLVPMPDWRHWKRVRYFGVEHFAGFRYGKEHHVLAIAFVQDLPAGTPVTSEACMRHFEDWGRPQVKVFDVKFEPFGVRFTRWHDKTVHIHHVDGEFSSGFSTTQFSAAWAAFPAYESACLIYAVAVPWRRHPELARRVRDRWVEEGFSHVEPKTKERPYRKEKS